MCHQPQWQHVVFLGSFPDQRSESSFFCSTLCPWDARAAAGSGTGKAQPATGVCSQEWRGKARGILGGWFIPCCCLFPPSSGPAPPQNHSRLGRLNSPPMAWWWRYKWDWKCPQEKEDTIKAFLSSCYSHHCIILHNRGDECPALGVLSLQTGCITPFQAREEFQSQNTGRKREEKGPFLL